MKIELLNYKNRFWLLILLIGVIGCSPKKLPPEFEISTDQTLLHSCRVAITLKNGAVISSNDDRYSLKTAKEGQKNVLYFTDSKHILDFKFSYELLDKQSFKSFLTVQNNSDSSLFIDKIESLIGQFEKKENKPVKALVTSENWQDNKIVYTLSDSLHEINSMFTMAINAPELAAGFLTGKQHFNHFTLTDKSGSLSLSAWGEGNGCELPAGKSRAADPLFISFHKNSLQQLERFADLAARENNVKLWPENRAVWCTWYAGWNREKMYSYKEGIAKGIQDNIPLVKRHFLDRGGNTMRICDDHIAYGDWNDTTTAFPKGLSEMANLVNEAGLTAGVWYPIFWASTGSETFQKHPEWMALEPDGSPYILKDEFQNTSRLKKPFKFSVFDASVPEVQQYFEASARKWRKRGFEYVTNDFLAFATAPDQYHNPTFSKAQVLRAGLEAVKKGLGDEVFYRTIGGQFGTVMGLSHDVRIAGDSHGDRPFAYHRTGAAWFYNHRTWINDPSAIIFMRYGELRNVEWNKMWVSWIALAGTVMTYGEQLDDLPEQYISIYKKVFPPLKVPGRPLDIWENEPFVLWGMQPDPNDNAYGLFGIFDVEGKGGKKVDLNLDEIYARTTNQAVESIGDMPEKYLLWDFWNEQLIPSSGHVLSLDMPVKSCRLFALRKYQGVPQLLGTNGHFSMGALETNAIHWDEETSILSGEVKGNGGDDTTLFFYIPDTFKLLTAGIEGQNVVPIVKNGILSLAVPAGKNRQSFSLRFEGKPAILKTRTFEMGNPAKRY